MKIYSKHRLLSNALGGLKTFLFAATLAAVAQGAVESSEARSSSIRFESRPWAEAVYNAASASDSITIEGGRLQQSTTWTPPNTHLVFNSVYVPRNITLTIVTNSVVKFCEGTFIKVEDGGKLNIVGSEEENVILTAANDNTIGTTVPELDPDETLVFKGIVLQSSSATFTDNGWIETRGFNFSSYPNLTIRDLIAFRSNGLAIIPISVSGTRNQSFMIDWEAIDGTATFSNDYMLASGSITWTSTSDSGKSIQIPLVTNHITGTNTSFTIRIKAARGANILQGTSVVTIKELTSLNIDSDSKESEAIRFESRLWAEAVFNAASTNDNIIIEGGRLKANTTWNPPETHLVFNTVYIPNGITLTINAGVVVKFCEGTCIKVEDGGKLNIIGAEGEDVILTAANDNTVGVTMPGLNPEETIEFSGIVLSSSSAAFTDNSWLQTKGFKISTFPNISIGDIEVFRTMGTASILVSISGTRNQSFSIEWIAIDGTATLSNDYTLASGSLAWTKTDDGNKNIEIPLVVDRDAGINTNFKVRIVTARGCNITRSEATVTIKELAKLNISSASQESETIRFESRPWAESVFNAASTNENIIIEGGRLKANTTWNPPETHLVFNTVYVPSGITLTINANTIVKFCEGTCIKVEDGGKLNIVGAEDEDVIFTAANDNTVGENIVGLDPEEEIVFNGIVLSSSSATLTDNGWLETRGFSVSNYPTLTLYAATANRNSGKIFLPIILSGSTRDQSFSIDWEAIDGTATLSNDFTVAEGRITWANTSAGNKNIEIPLVVEHKVGSNTTFTVRFKTLRGANATVEEVTAIIAEFKTGELTPEKVVSMSDSAPSSNTAINEGILIQPLLLNEVEHIQYSGRWQTYNKDEATTLKVTLESDNGITILKEGAPSETGHVDIRPNDLAVGFYTLKHEILNAQGDVLATMKKTFSIPDPETVELHGGTLTQNETWTADKIHFVYATVYVPTTYTLFIQPGAIVKFMAGAGIELLGQGAFFANGIIFTNIEDDTVGGDTLNDGYNGNPPIDAYFLKGNFHFSGDTELRNITQQDALTGTISSDKTLFRGCIYRVSGTVRIANGASLKILPGTIIKMEPGASIIVNNGGTFEAVGTLSAPITITSIRDDEVGGDTNKDGDDTLPGPGDWEEITNNGGIINFKYVNVLYGGYGEFVNSDDAIIRNVSGNTSLDCCDIKHTNFRILSCSSGTVNAQNTVVEDGRWGLEGGNITFVNGVIANCNVGANSATVKNSILWECGAYAETAGQFANCIAYGSNAAVPNGVIYADPKFADAQSSDFRIKEGSPCTDAADNEIAPELDYFGQPRITLIANGTNTVSGLADIGICEVMPRNVTTGIDLVPQSVNSVTNAVIGERLFIKWEIANAGGKDLNGFWKDVVSLVSENGTEVELGEKGTTSSISAGGSVFCSGYFILPAISEGNWYPKVNVNAYHDIFEGTSVANNALIGDDPITVSTETIDASVSHQGIAYSGMQNVIKLVFNEGDENRMVSFDLPRGVKISWGFGHMPVSGSVIPGVYGCSTSTGTSPVQFRVPEDVTEVYIIIETDESVAYEVSTDIVELIVREVTPVMISNNKASTVEISGVALDFVQRVFLRLDGEVIDGNIASKDDSKIVVVFNPNKAPVGNYEMIFETESGKKTFDKEIILFSNAKGAEIKVELESPDIFRPGRWNIATVRYSNVGDEEASAPLIVLSSETVTFKNPDNENETFENAIHLLGLADSETPTILRPGESGVIRIPFLARNSGSYYIGINQHTPGIGSLALEKLFAKGDKTDATWEEFLEKMRNKFGTDDASGVCNFILSDVSTCARLGRRFYCIEPFMNAAIHLANDETRTIVAATMYDQDQMIVAKHDVFSISESSAIVRKGTSNGNGRTVFYDAGYDWRFVVKEDKEHIDIISISTNEPIYEVSIKTSKILEELTEEDLSEFFQENKSKTNNLRFIPIELSSTFAAWVDNFGLFNIGQIEGTNLTSMCSANFEILISDWHIQKIDGNTVTFFIHGLVDNVSKVYQYKVNLNNYFVTVSRIEEYTFDNQIESPIWDGDRSILYLDEHGRILSNTNVIFSSSSIDKNSISINSFIGDFFSGNPDLKLETLLFSIGFNSSLDKNFDVPQGCCLWKDEGAGKCKISFGFRLSKFAEGKVEGNAEVKVERKYWCDGTCSFEGRGWYYERTYIYGDINVGAGIGIINKIKFKTKTPKEYVASFAYKLGFDYLKNAYGYEDADLNTIYNLFLAYNASIKAEQKFGGYVKYNSIIENSIEDTTYGVGLINQGSLSFGSKNMLSGQSLGNLGKIKIGLGQNIIKVGYKQEGGVNFKKWHYDSFEYNQKAYVEFLDIVRGELYDNYNSNQADWESGWKLIPLKGPFKESNYPSPENTDIIVNSKTDDNGTDLRNSGLNSLPDGGKIYISPELNDDNTNDGSKSIHIEDSSGNSYTLDSDTDIIGDVIIDDNGMWSAGVTNDSANENTTLDEVIFNKSNNNIYTKTIVDVENIINVKVANSSNGRIAIVQTVFHDHADETDKTEFSLHRRKFTSNTWNESISLTNLFGDVEIIDVIANNNFINVLIKETDEGNNETLVLVVVNENLQIISSRLINTLTNHSSSLSSSSVLTMKDYLLNRPKHINFADKVLAERKSGLLNLDDGCKVNCICGCGKGKCLCPSNCPSCNGDCVECHCGGGDGGEERYRSLDPNEISGPLGVGDPETERFVKPGEWLTYTVYFENTSNATAAAQEVYVNTTLSPYLDWSTFEMGEIAYNNQIDLSLAGMQSGTCETAANGTNYNVKTQLTFDNKKGEIKWYMRIVDPATETGWPEDILIGFLPPNDSTYRGEGHLTYRIKVREDAPARVRIDNSATIVFDYNDPIETDPSWWNLVAQMHAVEFDGGATNINLVVGAKYGDLPVPEKREGSTFIGWYTEPGGTGRQITSDTIVGENDGPLYGYWTANAYTVNYRANGGEGNMSPTSVEYETVFNLSSNTFTWTGHKFTGWALNETGSVVYADGASVSKLTAEDGGTVDLFASWKDWMTDVTFVDSENVTNVTYTVELPYGSLPCVSERFGWMFCGWFNGEGGEGEQVKEDSIVAEGDGPYYAYWKANEYTVNYLPNGGEGEMESQSVVYDSAFALASNEFTQTSYQFVGWGTNDTDVAYSEGQVVSNLTAEANGTVNLFAVWELWTTEVKFISLGTENNLTYVVEQPYGTLPVLEAGDGWTFLGWFTEPNGGGRQITKETLVEADVEEIYAHWHHDVVVMSVSCLQAWPLDRRVIINYTLAGRTNETLSVYSVKFYGTVDGGESFFELRDRGELSRDGVTGIVLGEGEHKTLWMPDETLYDIRIEDMQIKVEAEDVTEAATYLILDLESNRMRIDVEGPVITNDVCRTSELWLRRIEPGSFMMGSPSDELGRNDNEVLHEVKLTGAYYIGVFETTQKQYETIMGSNPSVRSGLALPVENVSYEALRGSVFGSKWPLNGKVDKFSFFFALREKTGNSLWFDLPTEAQWEYACRAGYGTAFGDGSNITNSYVDGSLDKLGWYANNSYNEELGTNSLQRVGTRLPNDWGLYDMHGNVFEWCLDWFGNYNTNAVVEPRGADGGFYRVLKGGSWQYYAYYCRAGYHRNESPNKGENNSGFRIILIKP